MFLKRFREKSNQKYINKLLSTQQRIVHDRKIGSVGVLLNFEEFHDYDALRKLFKNIGLNDNRLKFIAFIEDEKDRPNSWDAFFCTKDFGRHGKIANVELNEFIDYEFDALISYYNNSSLELNMVTAASKANFKIGLSNEEPRLFDLIIDLETQYVNVFEKELVKYLKVLNKI